MAPAQGAETAIGHLEGREARADGRQAAASESDVKSNRGARRLFLHERFADDARRQALEKRKGARGAARLRRGGHAAPAARERGAADANPSQRRRSSGPERDSSSTRAWRRFIYTSRRGSRPTAARASTRSGPRGEELLGGRTRARGGRRRGPARAPGTSPRTSCAPCAAATRWKICSWPGRGATSSRAPTRPAAASTAASAAVRW